MDTQNGQIIASFTHPLEEIILFKIGRNDPKNSQVHLGDIKKLYY